MKYKHPLTLQQQTEYLKKHKRVIYNQISEKEAQEILYTHNYINAITPFKYRFARKNKKNQILRDTNGCHIYDRDVEFSDYSNKYFEEREKYPLLYNAIMKFESQFNAIVSYEVLVSFNIKNDDDFDDFIKMLYVNIFNLNVSSSAANHMHNEVSSFKSELNKYGSPFIFFDRLSLNKLVTVYKACGEDLSDRIFNELLKRKLTFGNTRKTDFDKILNTLIQIRNCVMHGNSITVLRRYYDVKNKDLRRREDRRKYDTLIQKLYEFGI